MPWLALLINPVEPKTYRVTNRACVKKPQHSRPELLWFFNGKYWLNENNKTVTKERQNSFKYYLPDVGLAKKLTDIYIARRPNEIKEERKTLSKKIIYEHTLRKNNV